MAGSDVRWTNEALTRCGRAPSLGAMTTLIDTAVTAQVEQLAQRAREASRTLALLSRAEKDAALHALADAVVAGMDQVVEANALDLQRGRDTGMPDGLLDRLRLTPERLADMATQLDVLAATPEPRTPASLLNDFSWEPLQRNHADRILDTASPQCPDWLAHAVV